jgi:predicted dehydrogenase
MAAIRIGVVGARDGRPYLEALARRDDVVLAGVCDTDTEALSRAAAELGLTLAVTDDERLLRCGSIDAVVISTPEHTHRKFVVHALQAGLHVYCAPPVARTLDDCRRLLALAGHHPGQRVMIGHVARLHPFCQAAHQVISEGRVGRVYAVRTAIVISGESGSGPAGFRFDAQTATHPLLSLGHAAIGLGKWLAGGELVRVQARGTQQVLLQQPFDDTISARYETDQGAVVEVFVAAGAKCPPTLSAEVLGTEGAIRGASGLTDNRYWTVEANQFVSHELPGDPPGFGLQAGLDEFLAAIRENRPPHVGMAEGVRIVAAALAAAESAERDGATVEVERLA